jgi:hypothetical protein
MSIKPRNPFLLRASERIESDASFLRLYSSLVLESLLEKNEKGQLWNNILFIRSSPGAGKTSLLRLFEPNTLLTLHNRKSGDEFKDLFKKLQKLNVVTDDTVEMLGVTLTFTRNYEILEDLSGIDNLKRNRLFFSLLNSRIITGTLRAILQLKKLKFPEDLDKIRFNYKNEQLYFKKIQVPCNGAELYNWASEIERSIYNLLDSFLPNTYDSIEGHSELFSIPVLKPEYLSIDDKPTFDRILFMFDDVHKLSTSQRDILIKYLLEKRSNTSLWLSERLEALNNLGTNEGRDYNELNIENYWKEREGKFEKLLLSIASKRAADSREEVDFALESHPNEDELAQVFKIAKQETIANIANLTANTSKYDNWKKHLYEFDGTDLETSLQAKRIEILIHRDISKRQMALDFSLPVEEIEEKADEKVNAAAKLFLFKQYNIPYYYGFSGLSKISTNNIEQFLGFSAPLYERMLSMNLNMDNVTISAKEQDKEIRKMANEKWKELQKIIPDSSSVIKFLENLSRFCYSETYKPSASYAPGVNGFYIDATKTIQLLNDQDWLSNSLYDELQSILNHCLAFNLLHIRETMQGKKGEKKAVYYLNRWLCVKFDLPLSYGGWRSKKPDDLLRWIRK